MADSLMPVLEETFVEVGIGELYISSKRVRASKPKRNKNWLLISDDLLRLYLYDFRMTLSRGKKRARPGCPASSPFGDGRTKSSRAMERLVNKLSGITHET